MVFINIYIMANGVKTFLLKILEQKKTLNFFPQHLFLSRCAMTKMQYVTPWSLKKKLVWWRGMVFHITLIWDLMYPCHLKLKII